MLARRRWSNPSDSESGWCAGLTATEASRKVGGKATIPTCELQKHDAACQLWSTCRAARLELPTLSHMANQTMAAMASCQKRETTCMLSSRPLPFKCLAVAEVPTSDGEKAIAPPKAGFLECDGPRSKLILRHVSSIKSPAGNGFWLASRDGNGF